MRPWSSVGGIEERLSDAVGDRRPDESEEEQHRPVRHRGV
jgi:hypothetical protein